MAPAYVFSGFGTALGDYEITNWELESAVRSGYIRGFSSARVANSSEYAEYTRANQGKSTVEFFLKETMGFGGRYWVCPFPPHFDASYKNSVDLSVAAIGRALEDAGVHPEQVGAWVVSTVSPSEEAPGIAGTIKKYFVSDANTTPVRTVTAGCPGFLEAVRTAIDAFRWSSDIEHVVVAHVEIMSSFLHKKHDLVSLATFGDACGAAVLTVKNEPSRGRADQTRVSRYGAVLGAERQDPLLIGHLGVKDHQLYISPSVVMERAIANMTRASFGVLEEAGVNCADVDLLVPHQTGNKITLALAQGLGIPREKLFLDVQSSYGNLSGASIPCALELLKRRGMLRPGTKLLCPSVGVGGEFGAMLYVVPWEEEPSRCACAPDPSKNMRGKRVVLTGATSGIGARLAKELHRRGAELVLHYSSSVEKMQRLLDELDPQAASTIALRADFRCKESVTSLIEALCSQSSGFDYLIHAAGLPGSVEKARTVSHQEREDLMRVNYLHPLDITLGIVGRMRPAGKVVYLGSIAEDYQFEGSAAYVASKRALHGSAASISRELGALGVDSLYYMLGLVDTGMSAGLSPRQIEKVLALMNEQRMLKVEEVAWRIVQSLCTGCVPGTVDYPVENKLRVRRDGYRI